MTEKFTAEQETTTAKSSEQTAHLEAQIDEIVPILAHGLVKEIEESGLRGKVKVGAVSGETWAVGTSKDNPFGVPNLVVYPREMLETEDLPVINARLRHEIGNLNHPFEAQLTNLRAWCSHNGISPELVTALAEVVHSPSVDYLEMRDSHSAAPEQNFRALYEKEIDTDAIAGKIAEGAPYKQALDLVYLRGLSSIGLCDPFTFSTALESASPIVREVVSSQVLKQVDDAVRTISPSRQELIIRQVLWPNIAGLVAPEVLTGSSSKSKDTEDDKSEQEKPAEGIGDDTPQSGKEGGEKEDAESEGTGSGDISSEGRGQPSPKGSKGDGQKDGAGASSEEGKEGNGEAGSPEKNEADATPEAIQNELEQTQAEIEKLEQELKQLQESGGKKDSASGTPKGSGSKKAADEAESSEESGNGNGKGEGAGEKSESGSSAKGGSGKDHQKDDRSDGNESSATAVATKPGAKKDPTSSGSSESAGESADPQKELQERLNELRDKLRSLETLLEKSKGQSSGEKSQGQQQSDSSGKGSEGSGQSGTMPGEQERSFQQGGVSNERELREIFAKPDEKLLEQLRSLSKKVGSQFTETTEDGGSQIRRANEADAENFSSRQTQRQQESEFATIGELKRIQQEQRQKLERAYKEMSGLEGEALSVYTEYMEGMSEFIDDVSRFFIQRFKLDQDYQDLRNQYQGARLQRGFQRKIMGTKAGSPLLRPEVFERRIIPERPTIIWTLIIDNSGSCGGEIIEQEKKLAVGLIEIAKRLNFPLEIVTFGGDAEYTFLKTHDQEVYGQDLEKLVLLNADQGTPDVVTLDASCKSTRDFAQQFDQPYNFVYFMTDGQSGSGSIEQVLQAYKRDMVITGIGLAGAASTIRETWGKNALSVPEVDRLSELFLRKVEDQISETFD